MYETTPLKDLQAELGETAETGLSENEAKTRLEKYGRNTLAKTKRKSVFMHILCSFKDVTIIILCVAMALSLYIALTTHPDNLTEPIVIAFIIVLNIFLSVREQVKAEKLTGVSDAWVRGILQDYAAAFGLDTKKLLSSVYYRLTPDTENPYHRMYTNN